MDILNYCPSAVLIAVVLVVVLSELLKKLDRKNRFKYYKVLFPLLLSAGMAWLLALGELIPRNQVWFWLAVIFTASVVGYELVIKKLAEKWEIFLAR